jgi:hypothetical protein
VTDLVPDVQKEVILEIRAKDSKELPKKIGESMRKAGFRPGYPMIIIPGNAICLEQFPRKLTLNLQVSRPHLWL